MAITQLTQNPKLICKGTIGLGIKHPDKKHPEIADHFVLDDAPAVRRVYGDNPVALDIMFPVNDLDKVIPSAFKYWSGQKRNEKGEIIDGTLSCIGPGPGEDENGNEIYGIAAWRDRRRSPPADEMLSERDPRTGFISRKCWGKRCVDADNCKQNMQVYCILPLVSPVDIYRVDTSSWKSMHSFYNTLNQIQMLGGRIAGRPFRIIKKEVPVPFWDKEKQQEYKTMKPLMFLEEWDHHDFLQLHGKQVASLQQQLQEGKIHLRLPTAEEAALMPSPELYPTEPYQPGQTTAIDVAASAAKVATAEAIANDPQVTAGFDEFGKVMTGKPFTPKERLMKVRQKESQIPPGSDLKAAVLEAIARGIAAKAGETQAQPAAPAQPAVPAAQAQPVKQAKPPKEQAPPMPPPEQPVVGSPLTPQPDADGII